MLILLNKRVNTMNPPLLLLLLGFIYVLFFGGLSLLRREGLSMRFAIEAVALTCLVSGFAYHTTTAPHPALFLVILYLLTMRVRLLVDLGTLLARRGNRHLADNVYSLARRLFPDPSGTLVIDVNQGALRVQQGALDEAVQIFTRILEQKDKGYLGIKYEAASHYNLGIAYKRLHQSAKAIAEFNAVLDVMPASIYGKFATAALERERHKPEQG